jgi:hypothetical protein
VTMTATLLHRFSSWRSATISDGSQALSASLPNQCVGWFLAID